MAASRTHKLSAIIQMVDRITSPLRRVAAGVGRAMAGIGKAFAGATKLAAGLTVVAFGVGRAIGSAVSGVAEFARATDETAKTARRLGVTTEALSELRYAADRSGVSAEDFTTAMVQLGKRVADAKLERGGLHRLLKQVSPQMLAAVKAAGSTEEAFNLLADAAASIEDPLRRNQLLTEAFGRSGDKLASMVAGGAEEVARLRAEAKRLGLSLSSEAGAQSESFVDQMTQLEASIRGVKLAIFADLMPVLQPLLKSLADWAVANRAIISQRVAEWMAKLGDALSRIQWADVADAVKGLAAALGVGLVVSIGQAIGSFGALLASAIVPLIGGLYSAGAAVFSLGVSLAGLIAGGVVSAITAIGGPLAFALSAARAAFATLNAVILANPIAAVVAGLAIAAGLVIAYWEPVSQFFVDLWEGISNGARAMWDYVRPLFDAIGSAIDAIADGLRAVGILDTPELDYSGAGVTSAAGFLRNVGFSDAANAIAAVPVANSKVELVAKFENAPPGLRIEPPRATGADLEARTTVKRDLGRASVLEGTP
jgi:hypothetical protein